VRKVSPTIVGSRMSFLMDRIKAFDVPNDDDTNAEGMGVRRSRRSSNPGVRSKVRGDHEPIRGQSPHQQMAEEQSREDQLQEGAPEIPETSRAFAKAPVDGASNATTHPSDQSHVSLSTARSGVSASTVDSTMRASKVGGDYEGSRSSITARRNVDGSCGTGILRAEALAAQNDQATEFPTEASGGGNSDQVRAAPDSARMSASEELGENSLEGIEATMLQLSDSKDSSRSNISTSSSSSSSSSSAMLVKVKSMMSTSSYPLPSSFFRRRPSTSMKQGSGAALDACSAADDASTEEQAANPTLADGSSLALPASHVPVLEQQQSADSNEQDKIPSSSSLRNTLPLRYVESETSTDFGVPPINLVHAPGATPEATPKLNSAQTSVPTNSMTISSPSSLLRVQQSHSLHHRLRAASSPAVVQQHHDDQISPLAHAATTDVGTSSSASTSSAMQFDSVARSTNSASNPAAVVASSTSTATAALMAAAVAEFDDDEDDDSDDSDNEDDEGLPSSPAATPESSPTTPVPLHAQVRALVEAAEEMLLRPPKRVSPIHHKKTEEAKQESEGIHQHQQQESMSHMRPPLPNLSPWEYAQLGMKFVAVAVVCVKFVAQDVARALGMLAVKRSCGAAASVGTAAMAASGEVRALLAQWRAYSWLAMQLGGVAVACLWFLVHDAFSLAVSWALSVAMSLLWPRKMLCWPWFSPAAADTTAGTSDGVSDADGTTTNSAAADDATICSPSMAGYLGGVVAVAGGGRGGFFQRRLGRPLRGRPEAKDGRNRARVAVTAAPCPEQ